MAADLTQLREWANARECDVELVRRAYIYIAFCLMYVGVISRAKRISRGIRGRNHIAIEEIV